MKNGPFFIDGDSLQAITDARTFRRGREYARTGRVEQIQEHDGAIEAAVQGTLSYRTKLWQADGKLRFSCSCPLGEEETCCKHVVALGLAWLGEGPPPGDQHEDPALTSRRWLTRTTRIILQRCIIIRTATAPAARGPRAWSPTG